MRLLFLLCCGNFNCNIFRRPDFSPDGGFLVCPTGVFTPSSATSTLSKSYCCHIFSRHQLTFPVASVAGLDDAAIAVRFSPVVYRRVEKNEVMENKVLEDETLDSKYRKSKGYFESEFRYSATFFCCSYDDILMEYFVRYIYAVVTTSSVFVYDTQHTRPLVRITGCHLATINDAAWSVCGTILTCCSSDGYVTIIRFDPGALGKDIGYLLDSPFNS